MAKSRAILYSAGAAITSFLLTAVFGSIYLDNRIEQGVRESEVVQQRVDQAFLGICGILLESARPYPQPPTREAPQVAPSTPYGKELEKYNREVADRQARGRAVIAAAIDRYHCKE